MQKSQLRLAPSSIAFREHLQERQCMWLPVCLPVRSKPVPADVALWLFELRHYSDSNEVLCNSKVSSDCDCEYDSSSVLDTEELDKLGLQKSDEHRKEKRYCEVQEYPNTTVNSALTEDFPEFLIQNEECLSIHGKVEEDQNCHSDVQECPAGSMPSEAFLWLVNQKNEISAENQREDEERRNSCCQCLDNSTARENATQLPGWNEDVCVESHENGEEAINCNCECPEQSTVRQDIPELEQRGGDSIQTDKCDYEYALSLTVYNCVVPETGIVNADESSIQRDNQKVNGYQVGGESLNSNQTLKCHSILWETNPLYCGVDVEGSERGFRKLCHSTSEHTGNSIHVGSGEESELTSSQINEFICTSGFEEHGVDFIFKTGCLLCEQGRNSGKCPLKFCSKCGSLGEKTFVQTCQCGTDQNTDTHLIGSNGNEAPSCIIDVHQAEICGHSSGEICQSHPTVISNSDVQLVTGISNNNSDCGKTAYYCPTSEYFGGGSGVTASCGEKYDEVLRNLEIFTQSLVVATDDISDSQQMEPDVDFMKLCHEAQDLAEETIQQYSVPVTSKMKRARSITLSSDLSDDVFMNSTSFEEHSVVHPLPQEVRRHHSWDINSIFDDGMKPPVPPARLKKNKEKSKTIDVSQHKIADETTSAVGVTKCESVNQLNETQPLVRDVDDQKNLLACQELLIMKRVTESTKEKRSAKVTYNQDRSLCCQSYEVHQCVPDCYATDVTIVVSHCSDSSASDKGSESFESDDTVLRKPESGRVEYPNIVLTQARPISSAEFPPSEQPEHNVSCASDDRLQTEEVSVENLRTESGDLLLNRKGSTSSDITAWKQELQHSGFCYLDDEWDADCMLQPDKWFSSNDSEGRVYFFEENSNESSWTLPDFSNAGYDNRAHSPKPKAVELRTGVKEAKKKEQYLVADIQLRSDQPDPDPDGRIKHRITKAHSMVVADSRSKPPPSKSSSMPRNWPQLWDGNMRTLKEGTLNRTKITENGKKLRKNWAPAHVVLTELFLLFFKDAKTFEAMKSSPGESATGAAQPEFSIDLNGAMLEHGEKVSSRRNVFLLTTVLGLQVLLQCDSAQQEEEWFKAIRNAIKDLPSCHDASPKNKTAKLNPQPFISNSPEETKKSSYIGRSKSVKLKLTSKDGSQEDLTASSEENQTKIRNRLKKFFHRRPSKDILVKKGIYKDEPVFGCHLADVCKGESPKVPAFVQRCVAAIECKEENMKTDGLYRASGNLSQVQKIRLQVDQNNLEVLDQEEDVHVLTGSLKLFFRELKKPLIPFEHFSKAMRASANSNKKEKLQHFREIVKALPVPNRDTLEFLLRHLLRVTKYTQFNRMDIPNLSIVFGPTLMWPEAESANMVVDLMQQNLVTECFLREFDSIFH